MVRMTGSGTPSSFGPTTIPSVANSAKSVLQTGGNMTDEIATLKAAFLAEIEKGIEILRTAPPLDQERQERIDRWIRLAVKLKEEIAQEIQASRPPLS
jgi:hypothetical protein